MSAVLQLVPGTNETPFVPGAISHLDWLEAGHAVPGLSAMKQLDAVVLLEVALHLRHRPAEQEKG